MSTFVDRKKSANIIDALMTQWIGKFGVMRALTTNNGGEFNSDEMRDITSVLNVQLCTTAGERSFQNSLCERVHAITDMMLVKLEADYVKINSQTLLSWANMARNSLQMWTGYSSHQLVFGENPNLTNIVNNKLPALQGTTSSEVFPKRLNAPHAARKAFIQTKADERIEELFGTKSGLQSKYLKAVIESFTNVKEKSVGLGQGKLCSKMGK